MTAACLEGKSIVETKPDTEGFLQHTFVSCGARALGKVCRSCFLVESWLKHPANQAFSVSFFGPSGHGEESCCQGSSS